jgi:hypothetical protein
MLSQALQATPYVAIAAGILLAITIGIICYRQQPSRQVGFGISWRRSTPSILQKLSSVLISAWSPPPPRVIVHDPDSSKPHDLDAPLFDRKVQERVGAAIADAATRRKIKP